MGVSSVRSSVSSMHNAGRPSVNTMHNVGRSSVSSMHESGRATSGQSYSHQESSGTGFNQGGFGSSLHEAGRATSGQSYHHQESSGTGLNQGGSYHYEQTTTTSRQATGNTSSSSSSSNSGNGTPVRRPTHLSGNLSLHELNNRLERYIQQIRLEPEGNPTIINYERHTEGGSFDITSLPQYKEWESLQNEYLKQG